MTNKTDLINIDSPDFFTVKIIDGVTYTAFTYDANGNTTHDGRTGQDLTWNALNLISGVSATSGNTTTQLASYNWFADGSKYSALRADGSGYVYKGDLIYERSAGGTLSLDCVLTTGGRIVANKNSSGTITGYTVYHHITDHLGSVRAITNASTGNVVETSDFLPFGTRWSQTSGSSSATLTDATNRWRYSGKEEQKALNSSLPLIDYGARMYDPTIARWLSVDPMAEKYYPMSPYNYCLGNPIILVDPQGDTLKINDFSIIEAIYHGLEDDKSIHLRLNNGIVDPKSLESNNDDFFLNDLKELAESSVMVELSVADSYSFITDSGKDSRAFESAPFDNIDVPEIYNYCIQNNLPFGRSINGNTGRTLFPSLSKERSTNTSIQIIINSKGNLNHRTVGLAHELGHAILYVRGKPYQHGDPGVDTFIYKQRATPMSIRLGYDY